MENKKLTRLKEDTQKTNSKKNDVDLDVVQNIVNKMKKRSDAQGVGGNISESHLKELRDIISEGKLSNLDVDTESKLVSNSDSSLEKSLVKFYSPFKSLINSIVLFIAKNSIGKKISFYLTSANIKKTLVQHLIFSILFSLLISGFISALLLLLFSFYNPLLLIAIPFIFIGFFVLLIFILSYVLPMQKAKMRGVYIDVELPYALRHIATELQAGIGLYKVLQSVAKNNYGVLSEEMSRTIIEIENGTDTKTALRHAALRSQSKNYNIALFHIVRTLNTGGNLAETINGVADTVSFDLMESAKVFGEKMNFFGIIFIFMAIVLPVFAAILGAIANSPLGQDGALFLPGVMTPTTLTLIYIVALPIIFIFLIFYIKMIEPKM
jgi:flagellar protein FlaJ